MASPAANEPDRCDGDAAVIVGASGFVGRHLAAHLSSIGLRVYGVDRVPPGTAVPGLVDLLEVDILKAGALDAPLKAVRPQFIFHLAANRPAEPVSAAVGANATMVFNVMDSASHLRSLSAVVITGSAAEYGCVEPSSGPVTEGTPLRPVSLYGVAKAAGWHTARWLAESWRLPVAYSRTFNLTGPGEPGSLVCAALSRQLAEIEQKDEGGALVVHGAENVRDFVDVRDAVRAYWQIAKAAGSHCPIFNVCSGRGSSIREVAQVLVSVAGSAADVAELASANPASDVLWQVGSHSLLTATTGWNPAIALEDSLRALYCEQLGRSDTD